VRASARCSLFCRRTAAQGSSTTEAPKRAASTEPSANPHEAPAGGPLTVVSSQPPDPWSASTRLRPSSRSLGVSVGSGQGPCHRSESGICEDRGASRAAWLQGDRSFGPLSPDRESGNTSLWNHARSQSTRFLNRHSSLGGGCSRELAPVGGNGGVVDGEFEAAFAVGLGGVHGHIRLA
jgi:hypothetical protein